MNRERACSALKIAPHLELYHVGPSLDLGAMPTLFYFSLSGPDSLCLDPYCQIVSFLSAKPIRIFSLTLPDHGEGLSPHVALQSWAKQMSKGSDPLAKFLDDAMLALD